jgi:hypothetical protein
MAHLTQHLTSISPGLRSGPSPGRRLIALALCSMLVIGSIFPGIAPAGESDSEGVGTAPEVEVPVAPDLDPGGEETGLVEVPASGGEESGVVETEAEVGSQLPSMEDVTSAATEAPIEAEPPATIAAPEPAEPEPEPVPRTAPEPAVSEPVQNQVLHAPRETRAEDRASSSQAAAPAAPPAESQSPPVEPTEDVPAPPSSGDSVPSLAGKRFYVVQPGDCLTYIAEALLPAGATEAEIEDKVDLLWRLNEDRIGTGDQNVILIGTVLRLS